MVLIRSFHSRKSCDSKPDCFDLSDEFQCRKIEPGPSYQVLSLLYLALFNPEHLRQQFNKSSICRCVTFHFSVTSRHLPSTAPTRSSSTSPPTSCPFLTSTKFLQSFRSCFNWSQIGFVVKFFPILKFDFRSSFSSILHGRTAD